MKRIRFIVLIILMTAVIIVLGAACKQFMPEEAPVIKITVTGTLTLPAEAEGKTYVVIFDNDSNPVNGYPRKVTGTCSAGTTVPYSVVLGSAKNYYVYAYVENDNAFASADIKYAGKNDYIGIYGSVFPAWPVSANATVNNTTGQVYDITLVTGASNIAGTLTLSAARTSPYYVIVDTDTNYANGFVSISTGSCGGFFSVSYDMLAIMPGTFYVYAVVDVDNDTDINYDPGDELGYFDAASPLEPPLAATLTVPQGSFIVPANISLAVNSNNVSVTLKLPSIATGRNYAVWFSDKLAIDAASMSNIEISGTCGVDTTVFAGANVTAGSYYVFAYVDVSVTSTPNAGDFIGVYGAVYPEVPSSKTSAPGNFIIDMSLASNNVSGDVTGVGTLASPVNAYVIILTDLYDFQTVSGYYMTSCTGNFRYNTFVPFSSKYIVAGLIDVSGDMNLSAPGNKVGFAGNTGLFPYIPVTTPNISINHKTSNEVDIPVGEIPFI